MGFKKFLENVKETLGLESSIKVSKKKSIKSLIKKLIHKKRALKTTLKKNISKQEKIELEEELEIINYHIKKGKKVFQKLDTK